LDPLISVLQETRTYLARKDNDFSLSSWQDQDQAITEIDSILNDLHNGSLQDIGTLFAPTGPIQEVSSSSGWGDRFLELAEQFDEAYAMAKKQL
jgi:hypothetical protein